jgi:hypothetical protein
MVPDLDTFSIKRLAKFYIAGGSVRKNNGLIAKVLAKISAIPVRVEHHFARDAFEYVALSPLFEEVEHGVELPEVELLIFVNEGGSVDVQINKPVKESV